MTTQIVANCIVRACFYAHYKIIQQLTFRLADNLANRLQIELILNWKMVLH